MFPPFPLGAIRDPPSTWLPGLHQSTPPNGISVGSTSLAQLMLVTSRQTTHRPCYICNNRLHLLQCVGMQPSNMKFVFLRYANRHTDTDCNTLHSSQWQRKNCPLHLISWSTKGGRDAGISCFRLFFIYDALKICFEVMTWLLYFILLYVFDPSWEEFAEF